MSLALIHSHMTRTGSDVTPTGSVLAKRGHGRKRACSCPASQSPRVQERGRERGGGVIVDCAGLTGLFVCLTQESVGDRVTVAVGWRVWENE